MVPTKDDLISAIAAAARQAFSQLFATHPGHYYYCSLITSGEAHSPVVAAWSSEALDARLAGEADPAAARSVLKWSYADSPYYCYGEQFFRPVRELFDARPQMRYSMPDEEWDSEHKLRLEAMEAAMAQLDSEGIFGRGDTRFETVVLVEVMPPDHTNIARALRLNPPEALEIWLAEGTN